jgi:hypothetical protein
MVRVLPAFQQLYDDRLATLPVVMSLLHEAVSLRELQHGLR